MSTGKLCDSELCRYGFTLTVTLKNCIYRSHQRRALPRRPPRRCQREPSAGEFRTREPICSEANQQGYSPSHPRPRGMPECMPEGLTAAAAAAAAAAATDQPRAPLKEIDRGDDIRLPMLRETGALRRSNYAFYSSKLA